MFPERLWLALGSGQRLNEDVTGLPWPEKAERTARLGECAAVIRALFEGETVTHRGRVTVVDAKLYSRPKKAPLLVAGAVTPDTARTVAGWADGLVTVGIEPGKLRAVVEAFREGGGAGKPVFLQTKVCWDTDTARALAEAHGQWAANMLEGDANWDLRTPEDFETASRFVRPEDVHSCVRVSSDSDARRHGSPNWWISVSRKSSSIRSDGTRMPSWRRSAAKSCRSSAPSAQTRSLRSCE